MGIIVAAVAVVAVVFAVSIVVAIPVWFLWNWLCPDLFGLPSVTLWQAWGLSLLCGLLFTSSSGSGSE